MNARAALEQLSSANFLIKQAIRRRRRFKKLNSTGHDLVIYCGRTRHQWGPGQLGGFGSEEAVVNLAPVLKKFGWQITVYNNCGHDPVFDRGVIYRPFWEFSPWDKQDVVILWRSLKPLDLAINATKIFLDLHDVTDQTEFSPARLNKIERVFVKSEFHRALYSKLPDEKFAIIPNGLDLPQPEGSAGRDPNLLINTSSPDRSLDVLPSLFRAVRDRVPAARLQWAYGWDHFKLNKRKDSAAIRWMERTEKELDAAGIESLGHLSYTEVGKLYQRGAVLAYPTEFPEIDCLSVKKAQALGCVPVTTDVGALQESVQFGIKISLSTTWDRRTSSKRLHYGIQDASARQAWINAVVNLLTNQSRREELSRAGVAWARRFAWHEIAERWNDVLRGSA